MSQWVLDYPEAVVQFSERYLDEVGDGSKAPLLSLFATGGGMSLGELLIVPGASARILGMHMPYEQGETLRFLEPTLGALDKFDFCSEKTISKYLQALEHRNRGNSVAPIISIVISAALTTTRWRRGDNRAFVGIHRPDGSREFYKIAISKQEKAEWEALYIVDGGVNMQALAGRRRAEDESISRAVMSLLLNDPSFASLNNGEYIARLYDSGSGGLTEDHNHWLDGEG
tara:strand:- start:461429 stop:462115 length:687 start_codon:yes stop_codon:yes gene_type:complete